MSILYLVQLCVSFLGLSFKLILNQILIAVLDKSICVSGLCVQKIQFGYLCVLQLSIP